MPSGFLWYPVIAVVAHLVEEFVWPGGFAEWYRHYPPGRVVRVSTRFLIVVNVAFVALALLPPLLGATPRGLAVWMVVAAVAAANGVFHAIAVVRSRVYSPGVVTGLALYVPLAVFGALRLTSLGLVSFGTLAQAIVIGIGYHLWSAHNHARHVVAAA